MSAENADPFERVWFSRTRGEKAHRSANCAAHSGTYGPIPSFRAFAEDAGTEFCGICMTHHLTEGRPDDVPVGPDLAALRDRLDMTQAELADELGVTSSSVANWETQGVTPSADVAETLVGLTDEVERDEDEETRADYEGYPRECCGETLDDSLAWAIHRTEAHNTPQSTLGYLEPGEFEEHVSEAETIGDLRDAVGWSNERLFRALNIYGLADVVGPSGPDVDDVDAGDDSWKQLYQSVATDGGSR